MRKEHKSVAYSMRASPYFSNLAPLAIQETSLISDIYFHPIIFEQICFSQNFDYESMQNDYRRIFRGPVIRKIEDLHVIVLVHGFQGNSNDLKILKDYISLVYPKCFFLESNLNESKTDGDIKEMGFRLAKELISYLSE